jgi:enoyl-CoA hydratase
MSLIIYHKLNNVVRISLNRPEKRNALNVALQDELVEAMSAAEADRDVRTVILKGEGKAFCSGYDISPSAWSDYEGQLTMRDDIQNLRRVVSRFAKIWELSKPVIAQVHGYCLAGGTDLALHCDMVIAAEDAIIGYPPVRAMGSPPTHMWTYLVGPQWAKYMLLSGDTIDGKTAERIGLILRAVPAEKLEEEVMELAEKMANTPWDLLAVNKSIVNKAVELMGRSLLQQMAAESDAIAHQAPIVGEFFKMSAEKGLKAAIESHGTAPSATTKKSNRRR